MKDGTNFSTSQSNDSGVVIETLIWILLVSDFRDIKELSIVPMTLEWPGNLNKSASMPPGTEREAAQTSERCCFQLSFLHFITLFYTLGQRGPRKVPGTH